MRKLVRRFWGGIILLVLVVAVGVQLGREAFPMLNDYRDVIADQMSEALDVDVDIGAIEARWVGLRPELKLKDVSLQSEEGRRVFAVGHIQGQLSLVNSLRQGQLVWRQLQFTGLHMQFEQADDGRWNLGGLGLARPRADDSMVTDPLDIFLMARHLTLTDSTFEFAFRTGHEAALSVPELLLENEDGFHRLAANFSVDGDEQAFAVVIEGHGEPRAEENFRVAGHLALENFPMEKVVAALDIAAWDAASEGQWSEGHRLDTRVWFGGNPYRHMELKGRIRADGLPLKAPQDVQLPEGLQAEITGSWQARQGWQLNLQDAEIYWNTLTSPQFNLVLKGAFNEPLQVAIDEIDLAAWRELAERTGMLQGKLQKVIATLAPEGKLTRIHLEQRAPEQGHFHMRANLRNARFAAYKGAPAIERLDGFVEASSQAGRVVIDSPHGFSMFYPEIYRQPMMYERAMGELRWAIRREMQQVEVFSGLISLSGEEGEGRGYIHLILPYGRQGRVPHMTLLVGLQNSDARFHPTYVPSKVPEALYAWLEDSTGRGDISEAGFLWHGPLREQEGGSRPAIQLFGYIDQAALRFSPDWPALEQAQGRLVLDNRELDVHINSGAIGGNLLQQVRVQLRRQPDETPVLLVSGRAQGDLGDALQLLRESPVAKHIGGEFETWRGSGAVRTQVDLAVPLQGDSAAGKYEVHADLSDAQVTLPPFRLAFDRISGPLHYTTAQGLNSQGLDFVLWGKPGTVKLATAVEAGSAQELKLEFQSAVAIDPLVQWLRQPAVGRVVSGATDVAGSIRIALGQAKQLQGNVKIDITSGLEGVAVTLPAPYGKEAQQTQPLSVKGTIAELQHFQVAYADLLRAQFRLGEQPDSASLAFGSSYEPLESGYFDVSGRVGKVDLQAWQQVLQRFQDGSAETGALPVGPNTAGSAADWPLKPRFDLHLKALQLEQFALEQLYLAGEHRDARWRLDVRSPHLYGEIFVFDDNHPLQVNLKTLRLPSADSPPTPSENPVGALKGIDLGSLPAVNFSVESLSAGEKSYGSWAFHLRPIDGGISLQNLRGQVYGLTVDGRGANMEGAELIWLQSRERNSTYFGGRVSTGDLGEVLQALGQPELLESRSAQFDLELLWPEAPDAPRLEHLQGSVGVEINKGRFIRGAEAGNNPFLRLFGLLNFDTLARRLKLDFSDLYKEGMAFDSVSGKLYFANGQVVVNEPLRVQSPSATLQFAGVLDAKTEQINASLVATLPMTGNLTFAAAIVGGLPAAVGVYAVGKLFKEQVDRVSSVRYHIGGSWNDPNIRVDRIFGSSTESEAKKRGVPGPLGTQNPAVPGRTQTPLQRDPITGEPALEARRPPER
jgi:uncharacterized protein (TIGR02099 family)